MREGDVGNRMHTMRPVNGFDSVSSNRASAGNTRISASRRSSSGSGAMGSASPSAPPSPTASTEAGSIGCTMVEDVINPVLERSLAENEDDMLPEEIETFSLNSNGFSDLE